MLLLLTWPMEVEWGAWAGLGLALRRRYFRHQELRRPPGRRQMRQERMRLRAVAEEEEGGWEEMLGGWRHRRQGGGGKTEFTGFGDRNLLRGNWPPSFFSFFSSFPFSPFPLSPFASFPYLICQFSVSPLAASYHSFSLFERMIDCKGVWCVVFGDEKSLFFLYQTSFFVPDVLMERNADHDVADINTLIS